MNPCELTATISTLALSLAAKFSDDELQLISAVLIQLGDTLSTIVAQHAMCNDNK